MQLKSKSLNEGGCSVEFYFIVLPLGLQIHLSLCWEVLHWHWDLLQTWHRQPSRCLQHVCSREEAEDYWWDNVVLILNHHNNVNSGVKISFDVYQATVTLTVCHTSYMLLLWDCKPLSAVVPRWENQYSKSFLKLVDLSPYVSNLRSRWGPLVAI